MPKLAASVAWMFQEAPLLERFALAASAGFEAVEVQVPYAEPAQAIADRVRDAGLRVVLINTPDAVAAIPGEERAFQAGMTRALEYASTLGCEQVHCVAGRSAGPAAEATFIANLRWAADAAASQGVRLNLEPLNTTDNPGYFLTSSPQAAAIIAAVGRDNVRLQFDCYHMQIMQGRLSETIREQLDLIGHIQIGGVPGRHEPDAAQEINYPFLLGQIDALGFEGWVGCEYRPRAGSMDGLEWARPYGVAAPVATRAGAAQEGTSA